jgi:hypothetical protein
MQYELFASLATLAKRKFLRIRWSEAKSSSACFLLRVEEPCSGDA